MRGDQFFTQLSTKPPFTKLHPKVGGFFKDYFSKEKVARFGEQSVVNTHFPPYPSRAFDNLVEGFSLIGDAAARRLYSVTLAVTNRCPFDCWHCYNAGRNQADLPTKTIQRLATQLQDAGVVMVTLTGGEPMVRNDLEEIADAFDDRTCLILGTTGAGLSEERARQLRKAGLFGVGISLDSTDPREHDRLRGKAGAFQTALDALKISAAAGLYPYIVSVATRRFIQPDYFYPFMRFAADAGAMEVHLLEPSASGKLAGQSDVLLTKAERDRILAYQKEVAQDDSLPILSSYAYLEGADAFGCGAGLTHLYIDGSGEVCPCQLVPLSFGNVAQEPFSAIHARMGRQFRRPRTYCIGTLVNPKMPDGQRPTPPEISDRICAEHLPESHAVPRFFQIRSESQNEVGRHELEAAYNRVHDDYDDFWVTEAAAPVDDLVTKLRFDGSEAVFEAGCGTGYATALLSRRAGNVVAADISEGMLANARRRLWMQGAKNVLFVTGDALEILAAEGPFELVFSSWVLGYIPLAPFFSTAAEGLAPGGRLAFVVHKENSPREPLEIFAQLVARDPTVLTQRVAFDFPRDLAQIKQQMAAAGLDIEYLWEGSVTFRYDTSEGVLEHLIKSGAGTAFHDAIDPARRGALTQEFLDIFASRHYDPNGYEVSHEYVACIAKRT